MLINNIQLNMYFCLSLQINYFVIRFETQIKTSRRLTVKECTASGTLRCLEVSYSSAKIVEGHQRNTSSDRYKHTIENTHAKHKVPRSVMVVQRTGRLRRPGTQKY